MDWSGVDYLWIIVMFLSAVWTRVGPIDNAIVHRRWLTDITMLSRHRDSHPDGTHSLQMIHW